MAVIETTRNEQGEFIALYVRENSLRDECDGFRSDLREACDGLRNDLKKGFAKLNQALLISGIIMIAGSSAGIYLVLVLAGWK